MPTPHQAMTTEEFVRDEVFQQPTINMRKRDIAQTGADDRMDMTPDNAPKYQRTEFATKKGTVFGVMELFRNDEGQITQCSTIFGTKKKVTEYVYDHKGRLVAVKTNGLLTEQYRYGSRGERLQELNGTRYVYNYSSQLEQMRTSRGNIAFVYDDEGESRSKTWKIRRDSI